MALRKIMTEKEPALHKVCRPVTEFNGRLHRLLDDLCDTLEDAGGAGLAAPQVGILRRVAVVDIGEEMRELVNPEILEQSGTQDGPEGCLSVPGRWGQVERPNYVKIRAQDRFGNWFEAEGEALIARCFCHELEHLDGHLYTEKVSRFLTEEEIEQMGGGILCALYLWAHRRLPPPAWRDFSPGDLMWWRCIPSRIPPRTGG